MIALEDEDRLSLGGDIKELSEIIGMFYILVGVYVTSMYAFFLFNESTFKICAFLRIRHRRKKVVDKS